MRYCFVNGLLERRRFGDKIKYNQNKLFKNAYTAYSLSVNLTNRYQK